MIFLKLFRVPVENKILEIDDQSHWKLIIIKMSIKSYSRSKF